jgi:small-conductance mechanosensitive channel
MTPFVDPLIAFLAGLPLLRFAQGVLLVFVVILFVRLLERALLFFVRRGMRRDHEAGEIPSFLTVFLRAILWVIGLLFLLSNLGVNITSLVAGLGVGGIAVALAAQNILGDLFSSFSIYFDKPFVLGDYVTVGQHSGNVKNIGLKTTRLQALSGEEVVIPNGEITATRIQNYRFMKVRRVVFSLNVDPRLPASVLGGVPAAIRDIVEPNGKVRFDRSHLKEFTDAGALFETVYYIDTDDYVFFMDTQQRVLLAIKEKLEREGIGLSYPTQNVFLSQK